MATLSKVIDVCPENQDIKALELVIECGYFGISFLWYKNDEKHIEGILVCHFNEKPSPIQMAKEIKRIIDSEPALAITCKSTRIYHNVHETLLFPKELFIKDNIESALDLVYGHTIGMSIHSDQTAEQKIVICYRVPQLIDTLFGAFVKENDSFHSISANSQLANLDMQDDSVFCTFYQNAFRVLVYRDGKLQMLNYFNYQIPLDVNYHLLNICKQFNMTPEKTNLIIEGMIEKKSNLFEALCKYFVNTTVAGPKQGISLSKELEKYPAHYFNYLISLAACAS